MLIILYGERTGATHTHTHTGDWRTLYAESEDNAVGVDRLGKYNGRIGCELGMYCR